MTTHPTDNVVEGRAETEPEGLDAYTRALTAQDFAWVQRFLYDRTGIVLKDGKQAMVTGRLARRLRHHGDDSYAQYFARIARPGDPETAIAVDLLTTNETYFFREPEHFRMLPSLLEDRPRGQVARVWSAASSSGEEAFTIAMTLSEALGPHGWEILGTDISTRVVERARQAVYPMDAAARIPDDLLRKYCLKGRGHYDGYLAVRPELSSRVKFTHLNLMDPLEQLGSFDVIFLRNVMIYFDLETKSELVARVARRLRPGGYLLVSHSETLNGMRSGLTMIRPSVYRAPLREGT